MVSRGSDRVQVVVARRGKGCAIAGLASRQSPQKPLDLVVGSQKREDHLILCQIEKRTERETGANLPDARRVQLSQANPAMLLGVRKGCFDLQQELQNSRLVGGTGGAASLSKSRQEGNLQRFLAMSFFRNLAAARAEPKVLRGSDSIMSSNLAA